MRYLFRGASVVRGLITCAAALALVVSSAARGASLVQVTGFGNNPTNLQMHLYVPDKLAARPGVLFVLHGCQGTGPYFYSSTCRECPAGCGIVVRSPSITQGFLGSLKSIVGGNIESYAEVCEQARKEAYQRMVAHAKDKGADAIIGMRYDATEFAQGVTFVVYCAGPHCNGANKAAIRLARNCVFTRASSACSPAWRALECPGLAISSVVASWMRISASHASATIDSSTMVSLE